MVFEGDGFGVLVVDDPVGLRFQCGLEMVAAEYNGANAINGNATSPTMALFGVEACW